MRMKEHDEDDCDSSEALDVRTEPPILGCRGCIINWTLNLQVSHSLVPDRPSDPVPVALATHQLPRRCWKSHLPRPPVMRPVCQRIGRQTAEPGDRGAALRSRIDLVVVIAESVLLASVKAFQDVRWNSNKEPDHVRNIETLVADHWCGMHIDPTTTITLSTEGNGPGAPVNGFRTFGGYDITVRVGMRGRAGAESGWVDDPGEAALSCLRTSASCMIRW